LRQASNVALKRRSGGVDGRAANRKLGKIKLMVEFVGRLAKNGDRGARDFRPDPVSRQ
jgi:hypothetical protein